MPFQKVDMGIRHFVLEIMPVFLPLQRVLSSMNLYYFTTGLAGVVGFTPGMTATGVLGLGRSISMAVFS